MSLWRSVSALAMPVLAVLLITIASAQDAAGAGTADVGSCLTKQSGQRDCSEVTAEAPKAPERAPGPMVGGGTVPVDGGGSVAYAAKLTCEIAPTNVRSTGQAAKSREPRSLTIVWGKGNWFRLDSVTSAFCSDDPAVPANRRAPGFDTHTGAGSGRLNGVSGATIEWKLADAGDSNKNDTARFVIKNRSGRVVLSASGTVNYGHNQAHH